VTMALVSTTATSLVVNSGHGIINLSDFYAARIV